jgi:hypothetical protein
MSLVLLCRGMTEESLYPYDILSCIIYKIVYVGSVLNTKDPRGVLENFLSECWARANRLSPLEVKNEPSYAAWIQACWTRA